MAVTIEQRLLRDIAELIDKPYPNIYLCPHEDNAKEACLVLTPEGWPPLHLTVEFGESYPLKAPRVTIQSRVSHPNVFGHFICASILNTREGYTPAYTLKGIAIQLLSFFASDGLEQSHGLWSVSLATYQQRSIIKASKTVEQFVCRHCRFGRPDAEHLTLAESHAQAGQPERGMSLAAGRVGGCPIDRLPNEMVLQLVDRLDSEDLAALARASDRISQLLVTHDVVRKRDLQCFVLKANPDTAKLGVGVSRVRGTLRSEFDLVSEEAFRTYGIRHSVHDIPFDDWLPLPLSRRHWQRVRAEAKGRIAQLRARAGPSKPRHLLFAFMNDVVVRFNLDLDEDDDEDEDGKRPASRSTLRHASEKAIESYFHLFHLLVCLATEDRRLVAAANRMVADFGAGRTSKRDCPNLGHLLVALLISDQGPTEALTKAIITEAVTRNVVWMLDPARGAGRAELSYLEPEGETSAHRLARTFAAGRTSYRLLMFSELFRRTARPAGAPAPHGQHPGRQQRQPLAQVREALFERHGGPPPGAAAALAAEVRRLQRVDSFPAFLRAMGLGALPGPRAFCAVLRATVRASMDRGYSRWALGQAEAYVLRREVEPGVGVSASFRGSGGSGGGEAGPGWLELSLKPVRIVEQELEETSFFPDDGRRRRRGPGIYRSVVEIRGGQVLENQTRWFR